MLKERDKKTKDEKQLISIYNGIKGWLLSAIRDNSNDPKYNHDMYLIESDYITKLKDFNPERKNKNIKGYKESFKVINRFQEVKEIINKGKNLELVDIDFINIIKRKNKKNIFPSFETYFGGNKIIVFFNNNFILVFKV